MKNSLSILVVATLLYGSSLSAREFIETVPPPGSSLSSMSYGSLSSKGNLSDLPAVIGYHYRLFYVGPKNMMMYQNDIYNEKQRITKEIREKGSNAQDTNWEFGERVMAGGDRIYIYDVFAEKSGSSLYYRGINRHTPSHGYITRPGVYVAFQVPIVIRSTDPINYKSLSAIDRDAINYLNENGFQDLAFILKTEVDITDYLLEKNQVITTKYGYRLKTPLEQYFRVGNLASEELIKTLENYHFLQQEVKVEFLRKILSEKKTYNANNSHTFDGNITYYNKSKMFKDPVTGGIVVKDKNGLIDSKPPKSLPDDWDPCPGQSCIPEDPCPGQSCELK